MLNSAGARKKANVQARVRALISNKAPPIAASTSSSDDGSSQSLKSRSAQEIRKASTESASSSSATLPAKRKQLSKRSLSKMSLCPACDLSMTTPKTAPMMLFPCGHTLCRKCMESGRKEDMKVHCVICQDQASATLVNSALQELISGQKQQSTSGDKPASDREPSPAPKLSSQQAKEVEAIKSAQGAVHAELCKQEKLATKLETETHNLLTAVAKQDLAVRQEKGRIKKINEEDRKLLNQIQELEKQRQVLQLQRDGRTAKCAELEKERDDVVMKLNQAKQAYVQVQQNITSCRSELERASKRLSAVLLNAQSNQQPSGPSKEFQKFLKGAVQAPSLASSSDSLLDSSGSTTPTDSAALPDTRAVTKRRAAAKRRSYGLSMGSTRILLSREDSFHQSSDDDNKAASESEHHDQKDVCQIEEPVFRQNQASNGKSGSDSRSSLILEIQRSLLDDADMTAFLDSIAE